MKKLYTIIIMLLAVLTAAPLAASAGNGSLTFSYDTGAAQKGWWGTKKVETYNIAIKLPAAELAGATIEKLRIPLASAKDISDVSVWLTSELKTKTVSSKKVNDPDILSQNVEKIDSGFVDVKLDKPYTIEAGKDVYAGYSFTVKTKTAVTDKPVLLVGEVHNGGLYILSSRTYKKWMNISATTGTSVLEVAVSGLKANVATVAFDGALNGEINKPTAANLVIRNGGTAGVQSVDYTITVSADGKEGATVSRHYDLGEGAIPARLGAAATIPAEIPALAAQGAYNVKVTLDKVNGEAVSEPSSAETQLTVYQYLARHRAVEEEYTGTWCGWCPRGFVALEVLNRLHPEDFIGISYHNGDPMEIMSSSLFPSSIDGFPSSSIDRGPIVDPYYGSGSAARGIEQDWLKACNVLAPADIDVKGTLSDDLSKITVKATTTFGGDQTNAAYKLEFVLISDSLHGEGDKWKQSNYYAGSQVPDEPEFQQFANGGSYIEGLHFNDVIVATSRTRGGDYQLPSAVEAMKPLEATYEFPTAEVVNTNGESLIQNWAWLRLAVLLVDANTGRIVNANKAPLSLPTGITTVSREAATAGKAAFYDLSGRRMENLHKGLNIVRTTDGRTLKVLR